MHVHTLTVNDEWFIQEGQIDPLSRTRFAIGHNVVVCPNKHVLLADFYDGTCLQCGSRTTVNFSRVNAIRGIMRSYSGSCPQCFTQVSILFQQRVGGGTWEGTCPSCQRSVDVNDRFFWLQKIHRKQRERFKRIQTSLQWILALLILGVLGLTYMGEVSHTSVADHYNHVVVPRTKNLIGDSKSLFISDEVNHKLVDKTSELLISDALIERFETMNRAIFSKTSEAVLENHSLGALASNSLEFLLVLAAGFPVMGHNALDRLDLVLLRNRELFELFELKTHEQWEVFSVWIQGAWNRFS